MVGKLEPVDLRQVWATEAKDFSTWLAENLDILGEQLGLELSFVEKEKAAGSFSADILAEDRDSRSVVIENQLEKTDHDHLGKLLTYLANLDAKTAIWISSDPRPEHTTAVNYLNEITPADTAFYLIKVQAYKIANSEPAPLFTVVAGASPETKAVGKKKKELAERDQLRFEFFGQLLEMSKTRTSAFENVSPLYQSWVSAGAGKYGLAWQYVVGLNSARVELFLAAQTAEENKRRFETLKAKCEEIEEVFGEKLDWDYNPDRKQQYIRSLCNQGGLLDEDKWQQIQGDLVDRMSRLEKAFKPHIAQLE